MYMEMFLLLGLVAVASNPSPYYAALGLVSGAGVGCVMLASGGAGFLSLVLFLVYLGGMLVVFAYSAALVAEPYPEAWGSTVVLMYVGIYSIIVIVGRAVVGGSEENLHVDEWVIISGEWWGVSELLCGGGWMLFLGGWALLLTLFIVLEVVRGHGVGALRAV